MYEHRISPFDRDYGPARASVGHNFLTHFPTVVRLDTFCFHNYYMIRTFRLRQIEYSHAQEMALLKVLFLL